MKYFKDSEFIRFDLLRPEMKTMLDELRERFGAPLIIASSYRDPVHNLAVAGASNSGHIPSDVDGLYSGIDFTTAGGLISPRDLFWIQKHAYEIGFRRIGLYADMRHIHLDVEPTSDQDVIWIK